MKYLENLNKKVGVYVVVVCLSFLICTGNPHIVNLQKLMYVSPFSPLETINLGFAKMDIYPLIRYSETIWKFYRNDSMFYSHKWSSKQYPVLKDHHNGFN